MLNNLLHASIVVKSMKIKKVTSQQYADLISKYVTTQNFGQIVGHIIVGPFGSYEWKEQKNGLVKYRIKVRNNAQLTATRAEILSEIEKKNQIILMEGKSYYIVMNPPQDVSDVV